MNPKYSDTEDSLIRAHYPAGGAGGMHRKGILRNRTKHSLKGRARDLGVRHHAYATAEAEKPKRWWDYPVDLLGVAPRAVLA